MWKRLDHPNIVAFKGITLNPLQLVSEWMPGGELRNYIKQNPDTIRINLVGSFLLLLHSIAPSPQLLGIAKGLAYLHSYDVVHGDLKGVCSYLSWCILSDGSGDSQISWWTDPEMRESRTSVLRASSGIQAQ